MSLWQEAPRKLEVLRRYCAEEGRDYDSIRKTFAAVVFINKSHAKAVEQAGELRNMAIVGGPAAVRDVFGQQVALGFDLANLAFPGFPNSDDIKLFMDEVIPHFA